MGAGLRAVLACGLHLLSALALAAECERLPANSRSTYDRTSGTIPLVLRTDYPAQLPASSYPWEGIKPQSDWRGYMNAVLSVVRSSGITIANERVVMPTTAPWWIAPWMDYSADGREYMNGLTRERGPDQHDLAPGSDDKYQVWAVGWYNAEGAYSLGRVFADPCNPIIPENGWKFENKTASFKFLFTDAQLPYLEGAPTVKAHIYPTEKRRSNSLADRTERELRLLQVDIAVRDLNAPDTEWVMGTYVWMGPRKGDGLFDNLQPVGLMWGNDQGVMNKDWSGFAPLKETALNDALPWPTWQRDGKWPHRPFPGFQGRLNGPADNLRSSCISCHGLAQWPKSTEPIQLSGGVTMRLNTVPQYRVMEPIDAGKQPLSEDDIKVMANRYFQNVRGGSVANPQFMERPAVAGGPKAKPGIPLDYSLQIEAGLRRMCRACADGAMSGPVPAMCRPEMGGLNSDENCKATNLFGAMFNAVRAPAKAPLEQLPRQ